MIWITVIKIIGLAAFCLLIQTAGASAQVFQWTDEKGTLHFTDNAHRIPESIRNSSALIIRNDLDVKSQAPKAIPLPLAAPATPSALHPSDEETYQIGNTLATDAPQEMNIVVVGDSNSRPPATPPCKFGSNCKPVFRGSFDNRQYIHPSVFDGGSRQYIYPGPPSFPKPTRKHSVARR